ncbi:10823_t:CDS:1, partial [Cetraspora pellucida]
KSGALLQRLKLDSEEDMVLEQSLLLETLKSFCPNITYFEISNIEFSSQLLDLIGNLQKLQFLTLWCEWCTDNIISEGGQVLQFAKILPLTLEYLDISYSCFSIYIDILLNNCNAPLKKLLIDKLDNEKQAKALIEFCIRKRTLNYVGIDAYLDDEFKKDLEGYVTAVPYERIVVNC